MLHVIAATLVLGLAGQLAPAGGSTTLTCEAALDSGDERYRAFDSRSALEYYTAAYERCPRSYEVLMKMARALTDAGEDLGTKKAQGYFADGMRVADTLRKCYPDSAQSYFLTAVAAANLANTLGGMDRVASARLVEPNALRAIAIDSNLAPAYVLLGGYYRVVSGVPHLVRVLARALFGWSMQGTLADSRAVLRKALELSPGNVYAHLELARTSLEMGERGEAIGLLEQMARLPVAWHMDRALKQEGKQLLGQLRHR